MDNFLTFNLMKYLKTKKHAKSINANLLVQNNKNDKVINKPLSSVSNEC